MASSVPFVGGSYELRRKKADVQRSVNLMPTPIESGTGKADLFLKPVPGLSVFSEAEDDVVTPPAACAPIMLCHFDELPIINEVTGLEVDYSYPPPSAGVVAAGGGFGNAFETVASYSSGVSRETFSVLIEEAITIEYRLAKTGGFGNIGLGAWAHRMACYFEDESFFNLRVGLISSLLAGVYSGFNISTVDESLNLSENRWEDDGFHAIAMVMEGSEVRCYSDGVLKFTETLENFSVAGKTLTMVEFADINIGGKVDELRVSPCALYTGNYTPATAPFEYP